MIAIFKNWWKQYKCTKWDIITLEKIEKEVWTKIEIKKVLMAFDDKNIEEYLKNTDVEGFMVGRVAHDPRILMTMFRLITEGVENRRKALANK